MDLARLDGCLRSWCRHFYLVHTGAREDDVPRTRPTPRVLSPESSVRVPTRGRLRSGFRELWDVREEEVLQRVLSKEG